jgi:hypothetical protein
MAEIPNPLLCIFGRPKAPLLATLSRKPCGRVRGFSKGVKKRHFQVKTELFGLKSGQNPGFAVTDSSTGQKYKLLIKFKL